MNHFHHSIDDIGLKKCLAHSLHMPKLGPMSAIGIGAIRGSPFYIQNRLEYSLHVLPAARISAWYMQRKCAHTVNIHTCSELHEIRQMMKVVYISLCIISHCERGDYIW